MRRRDFLALLGGAAAVPSLAPRKARAQQSIPVVGFLSPASPEGYAEPLRALRLGLKEGGYVEGENVAIETRWADNQLDRLPELASELVRRRVQVIVARGIPVAQAAKAATTTTSIVFVIGDDPVKHGLVASLARPGGNLTGINVVNAELTAKRLELMRELVPGAIRMAVLTGVVGPASETTVRDAQAAASAIGLQAQVMRAETSREIDAAFVTLGRERPDILLVGGGDFYASRRVQLTQLAAYHRLPATYSDREFAEVGGLTSYGSNTSDAFRQAGVYAGRILKGAKASELPVIQSSKFEFVINHQTARMLGLTVPPSLLTIADEVIE